MPCGASTLDPPPLPTAAQEMFRQGDRERELGLPISPLMDRTKAGVTKSQPGFFQVGGRAGWAQEGGGPARMRGRRAAESGCAACAGCLARAAQASAICSNAEWRLAR
jgi:hypothetical protein